MTDFQKNKDLVFEQVAQATKAANRSQESVKIIAVTKYVDSGVAARLIDTGIEHIGENRVQVAIGPARENIPSCQYQRRLNNCR